MNGTDIYFAVEVQTKAENPDYGLSFVISLPRPLLFVWITIDLPDPA